MRAKDLAYAAGFLDGEGSFSIKRSSVQATNTYKPVLDWFAEKFGGSVNSRSYSIKPAWVWVLCGNKAADFCKEIAPYLQEKRQRALDLVEYRQTIGAKGRNLTPKELEMRAKLLK